MKKMLCCMLLVVFLAPCAFAEADYDVNAAIDALKACWRDEAYGFGPEGSDGYLEIKNTRLVIIADEPKAGDENAQAHADELFGDVDCIVEFMLYSDMMGLAPYYQQAGNWTCVVIYEDGSMEVPMEHPFDAYRSRTYSLDLSGIVADAIDLNQAHNAVFRLLEE